MFGLCLERPLAVTLAPREHLAQLWLPWDEAAAKVFSPSNAEALRLLPQKLAAATQA